MIFDAIIRILNTQYAEIIKTVKAVNTVFSDRQSRGDHNMLMHNRAARTARVFLQSEFTIRVAENPKAIKRAF